MARTSSGKPQKLGQTQLPEAAPAGLNGEIAKLQALLQHPDAKKITGASYKLLSPSGEVTIDPGSIADLLREILAALANGGEVTVLSVEKELTVQEAANLLNVPREYLAQLLDEGHIPFRREGSHRRLKLNDVATYKEQRDRERFAALDELARLSQEYGGYEEIPAGQ